MRPICIIYPFTDNEVSIVMNYATSPSVSGQKIHPNAIHSQIDFKMKELGLRSIWYHATGFAVFAADHAWAATESISGLQLARRTIFATVQAPPSLASFDHFLV